MKLGLGTVQFGLDYGVSNTEGRVPAEEVGAILAYAEKQSVDLLDTAYGYGESESVLGTALKSDSPYKIVSKTASIKGGGANEVVQAFHTSLERLRRPRIYGLLIHNAETVLSPAGGEIFAALAELKKENRIEKLGVSVYDAQQIDLVLERFPVDLVQLPMNFLDQRLDHSGHLKKLKKAGVEIHVRSAFLQGLLLMPPEQIPPYFSSIQPKLRRFHELVKERGISPVAGALSYLHQMKEIDYAVVGVCSRQQAEEILRANEIASNLGSEIDFSEFAMADESILNPSRWNWKKS